MKILIANTYVPFLYGGSEILAESLKNKLREYGHNAQLVNIPFNVHNEQDILEQMLANRLLHFDNTDKLICLRFPTYSIRHPNKTVWLFHQFRQIYDLWDTKFYEQKKLFADTVFKNTVRKFDESSFKESKVIYTISNTVSQRLSKYNKVKSEVLYPPLMNSEQYQCEDYGNYIYFPSRITSLKRQLLAVKSLVFTKSPIKLIISGKSEDGNYLDQIKNFIGLNRLSNRVIIQNRWISEASKVNIFSKALATIFVPYDEDYGFVTLESFYSKKAIITCKDSGGPLELVKNKVNGLVTDPDPKEIAEAIDKLYYDRKLARKMGENGFETIKKKKINWDNVISKLTI